MKLTEHQQEQVTAARAAGARRAMLQFTVDQRRDWEADVRAEQHARGDTSGRITRIRDAASQAGFFGDLRRAIAATRVRDDALAATIGIDLERLEAFREGLGDLPPMAIEKLVDALGLRLMHEIPRPIGS